MNQEELTILSRVVVFRAIHEISTGELKVLQCVNNNRHSSKHHIIQLEDIRVVDDNPREAIKERKPELRENKDNILIEIV